MRNLYLEFNGIAPQMFTLFIRSASCSRDQVNSLYDQNKS